MGFKGFLVLLGVLLVVNVAGEVVGEWFEWTFLGLAVVGIPALGWYHRRLMSHLTDRLSGWSDQAREQFLLVHEEWEDRATLAEGLGERLPIVPIRGQSERFAFHPGLPRLMRGMGGAAWVLVLFAIMSWIIEPETVGTWLEVVGMTALMGGGGSYLWWHAESFERYFEVDRAGVTEVSQRGRRTLVWSDLTEARQSGLRGGVLLRTPQDRLLIPNSVDGFGRLANIVLSRGPDAR